jgi:recombination protein RecA
MISLAASTLAQAQRAGEQVAYVDVAATLDIECLIRCGVQLHDLVILRPRDFVHALSMTGDLLGAGGVGLVVFDRVHLLALGAETAERQALERALREWTPILSRSQGTLLCLTEPLAPNMYPPGLPLAFAASLRLEFAWQGWQLRGRQVLGYTTCLTVRKHKLGPSGQSVRLTIPVL